MTYSQRGYTSSITLLAWPQKKYFHHPW